MKNFIDRFYEILEGKASKEEKSNFFQELNAKYEKQIEEEDSKYPFPIKKSEAKYIAKRDYTLKTDFCRNTKRKSISFLGFDDADIDVVEIDGKKYWQYQVTRGDISWINFHIIGTEYCDGPLVEKDFELLRCLIDVENGDYIYYPNVKNYKDRGIIKKDEYPKLEEANLPDWMKRLGEYEE